MIYKLAIIGNIMPNHISYVIICYVPYNANVCRLYKHIVTCIIENI